MQFELGWKMLKDLLRYEGDVGAATESPRAILKASYRYFDFIDEDVWLGMLRDRNDIMHVYDAEGLERLANRILNQYITAFQQLGDGVFARYGSELDTIA